MLNLTGPFCGNGVVDSSEVCDDGNTVSGDGCSATCQLEGDAWEPNQTSGAAKSFVDPTQPASDPANTFLDTANRTVTETPNIHSSIDQDWYVIRVVDGNGDNDAVADITLTQIPAGDDYDLHVLWVCASGNPQMTCNVGTAASCQGNPCCHSLSLLSQDEHVNATLRCAPSLPATGSLIFAVTPFTWTNTGASYALTVNVGP